MRLNLDPRLPQSDDVKAMKVRLTDLLREVSAQVNLVSEGAIHGHYNALTAAPTAGTWNQGDYVRNKEPTELGIAGSKYVIKGFICVASGSPGTWLADRGLTGN